jgi:hypothetical protein
MPDEEERLARGLEDMSYRGRQILLDVLLGGYRCERRPFP